MRNTFLFIVVYIYHKTICFYRALNGRPFFRFILLFILCQPLKNISANEILSDYANRDNWRLVVGKGEWRKDPGTGETCLTVTGEPGLIESNYWILNYPFKPDQEYKISCQVRKSSGTSGGLVLIGSNFVNRDVTAEKNWTTFEFYFSSPSKVDDCYLRFGQWHVNGTIWFRDIQVTPVQPVYSTVNDIQLGNGETIENGIYKVLYNFRDFDTNSSRCLYAFNCYFNTGRWDFKLGSIVIFKHMLGRYDERQSSGHLTLNVNYYSGGKCFIEASRDGKSWLEAGTTDNTGEFEFKLPDNLYPAEIIYVRLRAFGISPRIQINNYRYRAEIQNKTLNLSGQTHYADILEESGDFDVQIGAILTGDRQKTVIHITNHINKLQYFNIENGKDGRVLQSGIAVPPGKKISFEYPADVTLPQELLVIYPIDNKSSKYTANLNLTTTVLKKADYGYLIGTDDNASLWWTDATRKIGRFRDIPHEQNPIIEFSCAGNEYEPGQLVIRANKDMENIFAKLSPLTHETGTKLPLESAQLLLVDYVYIQNVTDAAGCVGYWPDPLRPLNKPFSVKKGENQPIWILFKVPQNALPGDYHSSIQLSCGNWRQTIPVRLHVWDFKLPAETHLQTAFGFNASLLRSYHHLSDTDNLTELLDKYFKNFAEHRISPYDPFILGNIKMSVDEKALTARLDFDKFDALGHKYLNQTGFNSFRLNVQGLGNGSFHGRKIGQIGPFRQGSAEYEKIMTGYLSQLQAHLEKRGWLDKAYIYWFDEPEPKDYDYIKETMELVHKAAPKLTRMLTEQPEPDLYGYVDLWCPKTDNYDHELAETCRSRGEKIWWYICSSPKEPFCTLFIDHFAVELRTWIWQSWKYGLDGILVWGTNYWTSPAAFPAPQLQNPYRDPMSYQSGYGLKPGEKIFWGNGDGRFIYPPAAVFESDQKNTDAPVNSVRLEILREGLEDYEYFWLLNDLVQKVHQKHGTTQIVQRAKELLIVPEEITTSLTNFSKNPDYIYNHRTKLAKMIETLQKEL